MKHHRLSLNDDRRSPSHRPAGSPTQLVERLATRISRRGVLSVGGLAGIGLAAGQLDLLRSVAQDSATIRSIIDPLATLESLAVTLIGVGRKQGKQLDIATNASRFLRAAQCEDEAHYHFLIAAGASAEETFTIPDDVLDNGDDFFAAVMDLKEIAVGATMAAARQFAALGELGLVEIAYQIGTTEAQHLALARFSHGEQIPNDRAFAKWRFATTAESLQSVADAGYAGDEGDTYTFPGPLSRQCRGVFGLVPETSDDQLSSPVASPIASPSAD
jgi:hypothetical protein